MFMKKILLPINYFYLGAATMGIYLGFNIGGCVTGMACTLFIIVSLSIFEN